MYRFQQQRLDWIQEIQGVRSPLFLFRTIKDRIIQTEINGRNKEGPLLDYLGGELPEDLVIQCAQQDELFCQTLAHALKVYFQGELLTAWDERRQRWVFDYTEWTIARACLRIARTLKLQSLAPSIAAWFDRYHINLSSRAFSLHIIGRMALDTLAELIPVGDACFANSWRRLWFNGPTYWHANIFYGLVRSDQGIVFEALKLLAQRTITERERALKDIARHPKAYPLFMDGLAQGLNLGTPWAFDLEDEFIQVLHPEQRAVFIENLNETRKRLRHLNL